MGINSDFQKQPENVEGTFKQIKSVDGTIFEGEI